MSGIPEFRFGISSWSYPWAVGVKDGPQPPVKMTAADLIRKAGDMEVPIVQIADNLPMENLSEVEQADLKSEAEKLNVAVEVGTKGIDKTHLLHFLEIALLMESPILRTLPALFGVRAPIETVEENLRAVLPEFEKHGIVIVLENQEAYRVAEYARLMQRVDSPFLRICLDLANALGAMEGPDVVMETLIPFTGNFHFKDVEIIRSRTLMGFSVVGRPSGQGKIPIHQALAYFEAHHLYPSVILELWPDWQGDIESTLAYEAKMVEESVAFMKTLSW